MLEDVGQHQSVEEFMTLCREGLASTNKLLTSVQMFCIFYTKLHKRELSLWKE